MNTELVSQSPGVSPEGSGTPLDAFDFDLPPERIAQLPAAERGSSRLMVLRRGERGFAHARFTDILEWLRPGDLLVRNDTKVFPARLHGRRAGGGHVEVLLIRPESRDSGGEIWTCLARPARRLRPRDTIALTGGISGCWIESDGEECRRIRLRADRPVLEILEDVGEVPLPPYITRRPRPEDRDRYQTVYAREGGSIAAPTAGLHFTAEILAALEEAGVRSASLTLHVGPGTFLPVRSRTVEEHRMLPERVEIPATTVRAVRAAKREGRRVIAVGTTTVRALEGLLPEAPDSGCRDAVSLFIHPRFHFRVIDGLITNFHLPRSTLLVLVSAFAGRELVLRAYREAVDRGYRFFSYGDAMLIL